MVIVLGLILGPSIGMFYLGKGRKGLAYLFVENLSIGLAMLALHFDLLSLDPESAKGLFIIAVRAAGVPHCYLVAKGLEDRTPSAWFARWYSLVAIIIGVPLAGAVERTLAYHPFNIPAAAMVPTLLVGDNLFISKFSYGYSRYSLPLGLPLFGGRVFSNAPELGDVAVFRHPVTEDMFIMRIVGLPGDQIQMVAGVLRINGVAVKRERTVDFSYESPRYAPRAVPRYLETLPNGVVYSVIEVSGDTGFADDTAVFQVPPGEYFMMGDNRDNSADSRIGWTVPMENFIGPARVVFWNSQVQKVMWLPVGAAGGLPERQLP